MQLKKRSTLLDKGELTSDERDYLNVLGTLVYEYEQTLEPIPLWDRTVKIFNRRI
ncbi:hypothetical protein QUB33_15110 [Microcoleus sp. B3-A4]|uniref:hypothetical protein n=1 Tax=Microcoleus sp. B3-A4 TaxID=2818653 RepID=UPI002FD08262